MATVELPNGDGKVIEILPSVQWEDRFYTPDEKDDEKG